MIVILYDSDCHITHTIAQRILSGLQSENVTARLMSVDGVNEAQDFPAKWFTIKKYLINQNSNWKEKLDNVLLHICLPLKMHNQCVQLTFLDLNTINIDEVASGKYDSLEASFTDDYNPDKTIISIMQYTNHFEPINVDFSNETKLTDLDELGISESFFN